MIHVSLVPPEPAVAAGAEFPIPAAVAAVVSVTVFWIGHIISRRNARQERQRQVIEAWFRNLSKWVDDFANKDSDRDYAYNTLTSRQIIELSTRKNRYLAWWMHEMALAIVARRKESRESWQAGRTSVNDLQDLLTETGEYLLAWQTAS